MSKKQKPTDRHLDVPAEANRDKHINFVARERSETDPSEDRSRGRLNEDSNKDAGKKKKIKRTGINNERSDQLVHPDRFWHVRK
jgi:hypothetical protein